VTRILLTGASGQVGWELQRSLMPLGELIVPPRQTFDLARPQSLPAALRAAAPDVIVNAAAYTAVDRAQSEPELAQRVNAEAPALMAREAARLGALFLHYSTDYVFDGGKAEPYDEDDAPHPLSVYGASKLAGERAVLAAGADCLVFRTSWVFGVHGGNFLRTMLRLAAERDELRVVADQVGAPTCARLIADVSAHAIAAALRERAAGRFDSGLYHLSSSGATSWHGYAEAIVAAARARPALGPLRTQRIVPIATAEYPTAARRPPNSRLACGRLERRFGLALPHWQRCLTTVIDALAG
jgi:dTDP-4-dehydrorhamnose reductase